jgi:hypothetical protein
MGMLVRYADVLKFLWGGAHVQINVFPFLRQLVIDVTAKAGWMPLLLPVFKIPRYRPRDLVRNAWAWEPPSSRSHGSR